MNAPRIFVAKLKFATDQELRAVVVLPIDQRLPVSCAEVGMGARGQELFISREENKRQGVRGIYL